MKDLHSTTVDELLRQFEALGTWQQQYGYLIRLGKKLPQMAEKDKIEENRVVGCVVRVWLRLVVQRREGGVKTIIVIAFSESAIVNGLLAVLAVLFSGKTARTILETDPLPIFQKLGLDQHLSPTRQNGLAAIVKRIRVVAQSMQ